MRLWIRRAIYLAGMAAGVCGTVLKKSKELGPAGWRAGLRADEIDVQAVFDYLIDGVVVMDAGRNIILMNRSAGSLLGLEQERYGLQTLVNRFEISMPDGTLVAPADWPSARALRGDFVDGMEVKIMRRELGRVRNAKITTAPVRDRAGRTVQVLVLYRDVTEQRELDAMRTRLVAIVESSDDAMVGKDENGIVTSWNRGAEKIFGYTADEMVGQSIKRLVPADHPEEEDDILARIRRGELVDHIETTRVRKDGARIVVSLTISPIRDGSGRIIGASKVARDITEKKRMERRVQQSQKMEAIGQLTGGIAHDFNNLLGVVIGNLDLLEPLVSEQQAALKRLRTAQKAALRGADLTRRLLAFSSNEELHPALTSIEHTIRNALELAQRALGPEIKMVVHLDPKIPDVMIDLAGLETLLLNLFVNARDAMPEGGTLTVSAQETRVESDELESKPLDLIPGHYIRVTVSDTGQGMSQETLERVFEPFFTTKPRGRGTGLGLSMAYGFAKQSGGTVRIYSELGFGTSVSLFLPIPQGLATAAAPDKAVEGDFDPNGCVVLIVDDEEDLLEIAAAYVRELGCVPLLAVDGASALGILEGPEAIDVMITDIVMPGGMSGGELARRARALRPALKIIYCSGFPADALAERASFPMDAPLMRKPYQRADVHGFVRRALGDKVPRKAERT